MNKLKIRLKLTGLELEIEGDRDQLPRITNGIGNQIGGLLQAPGTIIEARESMLAPEHSAMSETPPQKARKRFARPPVGKAGENGASDAVDFQHAPEKWANPSQEWTTTQKAIWLLFIVEKQAQRKELSGVMIASTFNKHFREAKPIQTGNVVRDLKKQKLKTPTLVVEDTTKSPSMWYLTEEGKKYAFQQITTRLNPTVQTAA